jgi:hypothetical protein
LYARILARMADLGKKVAKHAEEDTKLSECNPEDIVVDKDDDRWRRDLGCFLSSSKHFWLHLVVFADYVLLYLGLFSNTDLEPQDRDLNYPRVAPPHSASRSSPFRVQLVRDGSREWSDE